MGNSNGFLPEYDDLNFPLNQEIIDYTTEKEKEFGINLDSQLKKHLGFLYMRDALVIYRDRITNLPPSSTAHFEVKKLLIYNYI